MKILEHLIYGEICGEIYYHVSKGVLLPEQFEKLRPKMELSYEEQVKQITPMLQAFLFGKERTQAIVAAIDSGIELITGQSHDYFRHDSRYKTTIASNKYTFIRADPDEYPLRYRVRELIKQ